MSVYVPLRTSNVCEREKGGGGGVKETLASTIFVANSCVRIDGIGQNIIGFYFYFVFVGLCAPNKNWFGRLSETSKMCKFMHALAQFLASFPSATHHMQHTLTHITSILKYLLHLPVYCLY